MSMRSQRMFPKRNVQAKALLLALVLVLSLTQTCFAASASSEAKGLRKLMGKMDKDSIEELRERPRKFFSSISGRSFIMTSQRALYIAFVVWTCHNLAEDINNNLVRYIVENPDLRTEASHNLIRYFLSLLYPLYILAIVVTGFYILFLPGSIVGRSRAKSLLGKLIVSMVLVSFSPHIMNVLLTFTEQSTIELIGDPSSPKGYVRVVIDEYNSMVYAIRNLVILANIPNFFWAATGTVSEWIGIFRGSVRMETIGHFLHATEFVEIEVVWTVPLLLFLILIVLGVYGFLALRYFMVYLWGVLLPFTIFFSSFEPTRMFGKTMLEQTLLWSFMQVFYGLVIIIFAVGIIIVPTGMYETYGVGFNQQNVIFGWVGKGFLSHFSGQPFFISIFSITGLFLLFLGPLLILEFFRKLFPE